MPTKWNYTEKWNSKSRIVNGKPRGKLIDNVEINVKELNNKPSQNYHRAKGCSLIMNSTFMI